ncbi:hypothetical protein ASF98_19265 [Arthrobacter sp. Leaf337]|nr:hypothetical protein ASF98_19265 [Arthrobacter sp. Leaf337]
MSILLKRLITMNLAALLVMIKRFSNVYFFVQRQPASLRASPELILIKRLTTICESHYRLRSR